MMFVSRETFENMFYVKHHKPFKFAQGVYFYQHGNKKPLQHNQIISKELVGNPPYKQQTNLLSLRWIPAEK